MTNCRMKYYRNGAQISVATYDIYGTPDIKYPRHGSTHAPDPERSAEQSRARARRAVRDIALCNDFTHMFTFTFSKSYVDRYSREEIYKKTSNYLRERVRNEGFKYVCVPEKHEDGAIHLHGLGNFTNVRITRALNPKTRRVVSKFDKRRRKWIPVFDCPSWIWGYSHVTALDDDYGAAVSYITAYISKDFEKIFGKWYLSARECIKKPHTVDLPPVPDYDEYVQDLKDSGADVFEFQCSRYLKICTESVPYPDRDKFDIERGVGECSNELPV